MAWAETAVLLTLLLTEIIKYMLLAENFLFSLEWLILNLKLVIFTIYLNISKIV